MAAADALADADELAPGEPLAPRRTLAPGLALARARLRQVGDRSVLISMKPAPVLTATASRPCAAKTSSTWSGVTFGSSKRISHFVPPV